MVSTTHNDKTEKVGITLPNSLIKQTDRLRGDIPRSTYIRKAIEYYFKQGKIRWRSLFLESKELVSVPKRIDIVNLWEASVDLALSNALCSSIYI